jgi:hypothetical protein
MTGRCAEPLPARWQYVAAMADAPMWTDIASTITGFVGGAAGIAALLVAVLANRNSKDANKIAKESNQKAEASNTLAGESNTIAGAAKAVSVKANDIAEESAVSARESADAALAALKMARTDRHEAMRPTLPGELATTWQTWVGGRHSLFTAVTVDHDYRVLADAISWNGNSVTRLPIDAVLHAGRETPVFVEAFAPGQTEPKAEAIRFRFWPPVPGDGVDVWTCGCDEPELADGGVGHWTRTVQVVHPVPPAGAYG